MKNSLALLVCIVVCQLVGAIGSLVTTPSVATWYPTIAKPSFNPPNWLFAPVWITLYTLMGIAVYLVWRKLPGARGASGALLIFLLQLIFNSMWSVVFFGLHSLRGGLLVIVALLISIVWTIARFIPISRLAAVLLVPYAAWVSFAAVLNAAFVVLNP